MRARPVTPFVAGAALGLGAAAVQAWFRVVPPVAYGACFVCHPRDLVGWLAERLAGVEWGYGVTSSTLPLLTVVGLVLGAGAAARQHGEARLRPAAGRLRSLALGFAAVVIGLFLGSCPVRLVLLTAYGDLAGLLGWGIVAVGALTMAWMERWCARRAAERAFP